MTVPNPTAPRRRFNNPEEAFEHRTEWQGDCLVWTGSRTKGGYGKLSVNGVLRGAHQYAWERVHGPIAEGTDIDHRCFNRACVNVRHLRGTTRSQNHQHRQGANPNNKASGVRGVHWHPVTKAWMAKVTHQGKQYYAGTNFPTVAEAAEAARQLRIELFTHNDWDRAA